MKSVAYGLLFYLLAILALNTAIFAPPFLLSNGNESAAQMLYFGFSFTCHQLDARSLCYFASSNSTLPIANCLPQAESRSYAKNQIIASASGIGYKFPVCSRDMGIYFSMLLGGIVWAVLNRKNLCNEKWPHPKWLLLAMVPIALDGGTQLVGLRESTNELRLLTGAIVGFACAFYLVPLLNQLLNGIVFDLLGKEKHPNKK